jgi:hypothetical protein
MLFLDGDDVAFGEDSPVQYNFIINSFFNTRIIIKGFEVHYLLRVEVECAIHGPCDLILILFA